MDQAARRSRELFESGYCCAESVLLAVAENKGIESELIPKIATGFCAGMSFTSGLCGALSGGIMALNMLYGRSEVDDFKSKETTYYMVGKFITEFEKRLGSRNCADLLGCDVSTPEGLKTFEEEDMERQKCHKITEEATSIVIELIEAEDASVNA